MKIFKYKTKKGETRYGFNIYLGLNPLTNKYIYKKRKGYKEYSKACEEYNILKYKRFNKISKQSVKFDYVYNMWLEQYKPTVKKSTFKTTSDLFKLHILPYFKNSKIKELNIFVLQEFTNKKYTELKNYKEVISYLSSVFKLAINKGFIDKNPCDDIIYPINKYDQYNDDEFNNFYNSNEALKFITCAKNTLPKKWYAYFYLLTFTGLRKSEALALKWEHIVKEKNQNGIDVYVLKVKYTLTRDETGQIVDFVKTKSSIRNIELDQSVVNVLFDWKTEQEEIYGKTDIIFNNTSYGYISLSQPDRYLEKIIKESNLRKITLHGLRHTFASICFEAGLDIKTVQHLLGHSKYQTTVDLYVHITKKKQVESINKFSNYMKELLG